jgi:pimeloyl-ACP methyl ester carboxylesterase
MSPPHRAGSRLAFLLLPALPASIVSAQAPCTPHPAAARYADVAGTRIQYLDWGGTGTGIAFLAGLGDSPHAYDEIAPCFTNRFHVIAIARRGHGSSEAHPPFDVATGASDLAAVLDQAGIRRAVLVGWSMGGDEAADFAVRWPDRVAGVVFLDSYDLSGPDYAAMLSHYPASFATDTSALAGPDAFRRWWKRTAAPDVPWSPAMRGEVNDLFVTLPNGRVRPTLSDSLQMTFIRALMTFHPEYAKIRAPVLAFQARPGPRSPLERTMPDSVEREIDRWVREELLPWQDSSHARFRRALPEARIVFLDRTRHSALPFQARDASVSNMRRFLDSLPGR